LTLDFNISSNYNISSIAKVTLTLSDGDVNVSKRFDVNITNRVSQVFQSGDTWRGLVYKTVTSPHTSKVWLDRNLGASEVCSKSRNDFSSDADYVDSQKNCFGDYYQWGREADGHEKSNSAITDTQATSLTNTGDKFIKTLNSIHDWTTDDSNGSIRKANWSKTDGTSICPIGFRVPTIGEIVAETNDIKNRNEAFNSFLKLPTSGSRRENSGLFVSRGFTGYLWSTINGFGNSSAFYRYFNDVYLGSYNTSRSYGFPVRCLKD